MADLVLKNIRKSYGDAHVIHGVNLGIKDGEFVVFVGPSGCGKSTLLRMIAGLEEITSGDVIIGGEQVNDISPADRGIAMVFQSYALYPHKDVYGNMAFALRHAGEDKKIIDERVRGAADILGLEKLLTRKPKELSGGQRQRVAIGRAIVRDPEIFLFDEPLSNLDAALRVQMRIEVLRLHQRLKTTMIYVTHDQVEAMTLADRIVVLRAGSIEQVGTPLELYHHPKNLFVAEFIGSPKMNVLDAEILGWSDTGATVRVAGSDGLLVPVKRGADARDKTARLGIRPEHVRVVDPATAAFDGQVLVVERLGGETYLHIDLGSEDPFVVKAEGNMMARQDETVGLEFPPDALHLFSASGASFAHKSTNVLVDSMPDLAPA